jgi:hypothetical protein
MSQQSKEEIKKVKQFFTEIAQKSKELQSIPDKGLIEKIRKVEQSSTEVVKHIEERTGGGQNG